MGMQSRETTGPTSLPLLFWLAQLVQKPTAARLPCHHLPISHSQLSPSLADKQSWRSLFFRKLLLSPSPKVLKEPKLLRDLWINYRWKHAKAKAKVRIWFPERRKALTGRRGLSGISAVTGGKYCQMQNYFRQPYLQSIAQLCKSACSAQWPARKNNRMFPCL